MDDMIGAAISRISAMRIGALYLPTILSPARVATRGLNIVNAMAQSDVIRGTFGILDEGRRSALLSARTGCADHVLDNLPRVTLDLKGPITARSEKCCIRNGDRPGNTVGRRCGQWRCRSVGSVRARSRSPATD